MVAHLLITARPLPMAATVFQSAVLYYTKFGFLYLFQWHSGTCTDKCNSDSCVSLNFDPNTILFVFDRFITNLQRAENETWMFPNQVDDPSIHMCTLSLIPLSARHAIIRKSVTEG